MDNLKQSLATFAALSLFITAIFFLYVWSSSLSDPLISVQNDLLCKFTNSTAIDGPQDELGKALAKASMGNKTLIITFINKAYVEQDTKSDTNMFDLFLNSFWHGEGTRFLLDHVLIVAVDRTAFDRCRFLRLNCFRLETDGVDFEGVKGFMSKDFIKLMWKRTFFLLEVLKRGYNFIFTDTDIMWLRNPFTKLSKNETEDLQISTDKYLGNPWSRTNPINTGFYFIRSNNKTISLFEAWYGQKDNFTGRKEQDVLRALISHDIIKNLGLTVRFLDTLHFSGFCEDSKDFKEVATVHATCCRTLTAKVADLKAVLNDWKQFKNLVSYKKLDADSTTEIRWTAHFACWNSWKVNNSTKAQAGYKIAL